MSKNQGGIIQYVDFHRDEPITIISETKKKSTRVKKTQNITSSVEQKTAELIQFVSPTVVEAKSLVQKEVKTEAKVKAKTIATAKAAKKPEAKKPTAKKVAKKVIAKKAVKSTKKVMKSEITKPQEIITDVKANVIRAFFEKNKEYYDIAGILSNAREAKISVVRDITNEQIHKKAVNAIIKSVKSSRKFKLEKAS